MLISMGISNVSKILFLALSFSATALAGNNNDGSTARRGGIPKRGNLNTIVRDVVVLGGGATGTFAALKLLDANMTVVVIEQKGRLGGHTETYHDPVTGGTVDCGVVVYEALPVVNETFGRFNIPLTTVNAASLSSGTAFNADLTTGIPLNITTTVASMEAEALALQKYLEILSNYPYLAFGFDLPYPVPEDLTITFSQFIKKYSLEAAVPVIIQFCQGVGDILNLPMIYILKYLDAGVITDSSTGFITTAAMDNSLLYEAATTELGSNVLLNTTILAINRQNTEYVEVLVSTPKGTQLILAKQLLSTIPPVLDNLKPFDLNAEEKGIFGHFSATGYYTALIRNIGISPDIHIVDLNPSTEFNVPPMPSIYNIESTAVPHLTHVFYGSQAILPLSTVQSNILSDIAILKKKNPGIVVAEPGAMEFAFFSSHSPFLLTVSKELIKGGFYRDLWSLQGKRNTWWTGAAFHVHSSGPMWRYTEGIVKAMVEAAG